MTQHSDARPSHFIRTLIDTHLAEGRYGHVVTRFPPEPNGYLHIGHAKSICLNFGLAEQYGGVCHLRMDDTNPSKEETEYVEAIKRDVAWLGFSWQDKMFYASDYFGRFYAFAEDLIRRGLAYVDASTREEVRQMRGTLSEPGTPSPWRDRPAADSLDLLARMRAGEFAEGSLILRAKIDMAHPNMLMRDPPLYRIMRAHHHRTGDAWNIYPMYDYAHCISDALEGITHSICTLEFENNRELYDWVLDALGWPEPRPHQYEFARLNLDYTVVSKRKLLTLVKDGHVDGWDDPRMPTIAGLRRRGVTPEAIRAFAELIGVAKTNSAVDIGKLEFCIREDLSPRSPRVMAVLDPLEVILTNVADGEVEPLSAPYWPEDIPKEGARRVPLTRHILIERGDFAEVPPKGWHRLSPGAEVRLRHAYIIRCDAVIRDDAGAVIRLHCSVDRATRSGGGGEGQRKVKGTLHWVSRDEAVAAEVRLYDHLFTVAQPEREDGDFLQHLNPTSKRVVTAFVEPALRGLAGGAHLQFERHGYFFSDPQDHDPDGRLVFNKVVGLRDTFSAKVAPGAGDASATATHAAAVPAPAPKAKKAADQTRPEKLTRAEVRERRFEADAALKARFETFRDSLGLPEEDAELCAETHALADFFEAALAAAHAASKADVVSGMAAAVARWLRNELLRTVKEVPLEALSLTPSDFGTLVARVEAGVVSATSGKQVYAALLAGRSDVDSIIAHDGLTQEDDPAALTSAVAGVLAAHPAELAAYRGGKSQLLGFFIGRALKVTGGRANPERLAEAVRAALG
jgi:glutaminyl-tRNA synthetase